MAYDDHDKRGTRLFLEDVELPESSTVAPKLKSSAADSRALMKKQLASSKSDAETLQKTKKRSVPTQRQDISKKKKSTPTPSHKASDNSKFDTRASNTTYMRNNESPWKYFQKHFELKLDGFLTIASRRDAPFDLVMVKSFRNSHADEKFKMLHDIRHKNFLEVIRCFSFENDHHIIFEHVPISLAQIVVSPPYPTRLELAAILAQVSTQRNLTTHKLTEIDSRGDCISIF